MMNTDFRSDNTLGCSPEIIEALARVATGSLTSYGQDEITDRLRWRCRSLFETDLEIFPLLTGTAGNGLAIAAMTPQWGAVFCHEDAHIQRDELGAPEFFTGGAKLIPLPGADGKLQASTLASSIQQIARSSRTAVPACVSLTQATEAGTIYQPDEVRELCAVAHRGETLVHMDGARFANAVASLGAGHSPADLTWRAGVDILVMGGTKNGAMAAELLVVFRRDLVEPLSIRWHRAGHRLSKMRFLSAQLEAYLTDDLWLRNARHANEAAAAIAGGMATISGVEIVRPVEANVVFVRLHPAINASLQSSGFQFYDWPPYGKDVVRIVTGFATTTDDVNGLLAATRAASERRN